MMKLAELAADANRHLAALIRLDSIAALGPPAADGLAAAMADLSRRVVPCVLENALAAELEPRCRQCGFVLGAAMPGPELADAFERIRRALTTKLATLSRSAIARIIRQHDRGGRLEGFLKITQASQTEALVRVLDDELVRYLSDLLAEGTRAGLVVKLEQAGKAGGRAKRDA